MRYLCAFHICKQKFLNLFRLAKKKKILWGLSRQLNIQDLCAIYALLFPSILDFCAGILKALSSWSK